MTSESEYYEQEINFADHDYCDYSSWGDGAPPPNQKSVKRVFRAISHHITRYILRNADAATLHVYAAIVAHTNEHGVAYPSFATIGRMIGLRDEETIKRQVKKLEALGLIVRKKRGKIWEMRIVSIDGPQQFTLIDKLFVGDYCGCSYEFALCVGLIALANGRGSVTTAVKDILAVTGLSRPKVDEMLGRPKIGKSSVICYGMIRITRISGNKIEIAIQRLPKRDVTPRRVSNFADIPGFVSNRKVCNSIRTQHENLATLPDRGHESLKPDHLEVQKLCNQDGGEVNNHLNFEGNHCSKPEVNQTESKRTKPCADTPRDDSPNSAFEGQSPEPSATNTSVEPDEPVITVEAIPIRGNKPSPAQIAAIYRYHYKEKIGIPCPWGSELETECAKAITRFADWTATEFKRCIWNLFRSHDNRCTWKPSRVMGVLHEYAASRLNQFGKTMRRKDLTPLEQANDVLEDANEQVQERLSFDGPIGAAAEWAEREMVELEVCDRIVAEHERCDAGRKETRTKGPEPERVKEIVEEDVTPASADEIPACGDGDRAATEKGQIQAASETQERRRGDIAIEILVDEELAAWETWDRLSCYGDRCEEYDSVRDRALRRERMQQGNATQSDRMELAKLEQNAMETPEFQAKVQTRLAESAHVWRQRKRDRNNKREARRKRLQASQHRERVERDLRVYRNTLEWRELTPHEQSVMADLEYQLRLATEQEAKLTGR